MLSFSYSKQTLVVFVTFNPYNPSSIMDLKMFQFSVLFLFLREIMFKQASCSFKGIVPCSPKFHHNQSKMSFSSSRNLPTLVLQFINYILITTYPLCQNQTTHLPDSSLTTLTFTHEYSSCS